ncbi:hypothetical protein L484_016166 [Morus notabilis]|uniref:Uncharacterized protein n=1 Tax=Morus notabilis TaxID=981085 RepID=W9QL10_9ROSA|nr:hypothetical protein L484_016166 [Morus notabilis]
MARNREEVTQGLENGKINCRDNMQEMTRFFAWLLSIYNSRKATIEVKGSLINLRN